MSQIKRVSISLQLPSNSVGKEAEKKEEYEYLWGRIVTAAITVIGIVATALWLFFAQQGTVDILEPEPAPERNTSIKEHVHIKDASENPARAQKKPLAKTPETIEHKPITRPGTAVASQSDAPREGASDIAPPKTAPAENVIPAENPARNKPFLVEVPMADEFAFPEDSEINASLAFTHSLSPKVIDIELVQGSNPLPANVPISSDELITVRFSSRYKGLKGQWVFHEWYRDNTLVAQIRAKPENNNSIAYSTKKIDASQLGQWHVKVVDVKNMLLAEGKFSVMPPEQVSVNVD